MELKILVYVKKEWSPDLLQEKFPAEEISEVTEAALREKRLSVQEVLLIASTDASIRAALAMGMAVAAYVNPLFPGQTYAGVPMVIEGFEEVDPDFLDRIYRRCHALPWTIAETKRCVIREFSMADMGALIDLYDQPGVTYRINHKGERIPGFIEPLYPLEQEWDYEEAYIANMYKYYGYGMWLITEKKTGTVIGRAGLEHREYEEGVELELGYVIAPLWQRQGIATEVCRKILDFAEKNLDFPRVNALTDPDNGASVALLKKLGFSYLETTAVSGSSMYRFQKPLHKRPK